LRWFSPGDTFSFNTMPIEGVVGTETHVKLENASVSIVSGSLPANFNT
jgi:hypothetical protein